MGNFNHTEEFDGETNAEYVDGVCENLKVDGRVDYEVDRMKTFLYQTDESSDGFNKNIDSDQSCALAIEEIADKIADLNKLSELYELLGK